MEDVLPRNVVEPAGKLEASAVSVARKMASLPAIGERKVGQRRIAILIGAGGVSRVEPVASVAAVAGKFSSHRHDAAVAVNDAGDEDAVGLQEWRPRKASDPEIVFPGGRAVCDQIESRGLIHDRAAFDVGDAGRLGGRDRRHEKQSQGDANEGRADAPSVVRGVVELHTILALSV